MSSLGKRLKRIRESKKLSISEVARAIGVSPSTYREWEYGREMKGEPYMKLAEIFGISLVKLMTGKDTEIEKELIEIERHVKNIRSFL